MNRLIPAAFCLLLALVLSASAQPPAVKTPAPAAAPAEAQPKLPTVDDVLTRQEMADKDIKTLSASIRYIKRPPAIEGGGIQTRYGNLLYSTTNDPAGKALRKFNITFDQIMFDNKLRPKDKTAYIFDGAYLLELDYAGQQFMRKHLVGPNQIKDPLRIGEGLFPVPVGQRKADLLTRFDITVVDPLDNVANNDKLRELLSQCVQLKLVPKAGGEQAKIFSEIRLWYRQTDMLPIFTQTVNVDGATTEVFLVDIKKNPPIDPASFVTTPPAGWAGDEEDLRDKVQVQPDRAPLPPATPAPGTGANPGRTPDKKP